MTTIKEFLKYLISQIVEHPKEVEIKENQVNENFYHYLIKLNQEDIGKVIGKQGKIIQAIRNLTKTLAIKENKQIRIEVE